MDTLKRFLISSLLSFATGFLMALYPVLQEATTFSDVAWSAVILGSVFAGLRLVVKGLIEGLPAIAKLVSNNR